MTSSEGRPRRGGFAQLFAALALATLAHHPAVACASQAVDRARLALEEGRLEEALSMLNEAASGDDLTREELRHLLLLRASIETGLQDDAAAELDLRRLARLGVGGTLPPFVAPTLRRRLELLQGSVDELELGLSARFTRGGVEIEFDDEDDPADLVRSFRIWTRVPGAPWLVEEDRRLRLLAPLGLSVEYYGEAVGLGGVIITRVGSREAPRTIVARGTASQSGGDGALPVDTDGGGDDALVWVLAVLAVVAAGTGVAVALYFTLGETDSPATRFGPPIIAW